MKSRMIVTLGWYFLLLFILTGCGDTPSNFIESVPDYPILSISSDSFDFGLNGSLRQLTLSNTGSDSLGWSFADYPNWIIPSQDNGALMTTSSIVLEIVVDRSILGAGAYGGEITVESNGGDYTISVSVEQSDEPVLGELPATLDFGVYGESIDFIISNTGRDTIFWSASISGNYFSIVPNSGETTDATPVQFSFDREEAPALLLYSTLTITTQNESIEIPVIADNSVAASTWLSHCQSTDTYAQALPENLFYMVRFDRPPEWDSFIVDSVRIKLFTQFNAFDDIQLCCAPLFMDSFGDLWPNTGDLIHLTVAVDPISGWNTWAVNWPLSLSTFCVGYYQVNFIPIVLPMPYFDASNWGGYSYLVWQTPVGTTAVEFMNGFEWCIEVYLRPTSTSTSGPGSWIGSGEIASTRPISGQQPEPQSRAEYPNLIR